MTPSQRFEKHTGLSVTAVTGMSPQQMDFEMSLEIPEHHRAIIDGLDKVEFEAAQICHALVISRKTKDHELTQVIASEIGELVARELAKGNFKMPRIISEGLLNLQNGKPFKVKRGPKSSNDYPLVLITFYLLKKEGITQPSQSEVAERLRVHGCEITAPQLSKAFGDLELKQLSSDAREAASTAGKRKRGKR
jgi:hypothetical protein